MADDEHATTNTLRIVSPLWAAVRENASLTIIASIIATIFVGGVGWAKLMGRIGQLEIAVRELAAERRTLHTQDTNVAVLQTEVRELENQMEANNRKWERAEEAADIRVVPRKRR